QYDLANQLYEQVPIDSPYFEPKDYIRYGSSISEEHPDLENANKGFEIQKISLNSLNPLLEQSEDLDIETGKKVAHCYDSMGDLLLWKYQLSKDIKDLEMGIEYLSNGMSYSLKVIEQGGYVPCGGTAMSHLKLMIYLRIKENDASRLDLEHQRDAILKLKPQPGDSYIEKSYLRWFQAIAIADQGDEQRSMRAALMAFAEDSKTKVQDEEQGGFTKHVYNIVRRFILQHLDVLNNPTSLGLISQILQNPQ
ncbi:MAG TPA: hypothetical protein VKK79_16270, partial [Candidatus Lokiarchaeia archaeon]|nr:hypothetical protein [Candidatus Lokiarchaeia archaeon]